MKDHRVVIDKKVCHVCDFREEAEAFMMGEVARSLRLRVISEAHVIKAEVKVNGRWHQHVRVEIL